MADDNAGSPPETSKSKESSAITCHLLELPAELRNTIYELVATHTGQIPVLWGITPEWNKPPALANACRQLHDEVLPIYWGGNSFIANLCCKGCIKHCPMTIENDLRSAMAGSCSLLGKIQLSLGDVSTEEFEELQALGDTQFLNIEGWAVKHDEEAGLWWLTKR